MNNHPDISTLLSYAAGSLSEAFGVIVASHLTHCEECREIVRNAQQIGGEFLESSDEPSSEINLESMMSRLDEPQKDNDFLHAHPKPSDELLSMFPLPLARHVHWAMNDIPWKRKSVETDICYLPVSEESRSQLFLFRLGPNRALPEHTHGGMELTYVLKGSYSDEFGTYEAGDVADLDPDAEHMPISGPDGECWCVVATEAPTKFKNLRHRILQPYFGI